MKKSFTMIEALICLCIIGILIAALVGRGDAEKKIKEFSVGDTVICGSIYGKVKFIAKKNMVIDMGNNNTSVWYVLGCEKQ